MKTDIDKLKELRNDFAKLIKHCVRIARTEEEMDELTDIATEMAQSIPCELVQLDFFDRQAIRNRLPTQQANNTQYINRLMKRCWEYDTFTLDYDSCIRDLYDCIEELRSKK